MLHQPVRQTSIAEFLQSYQGGGSVHFFSPSLLTAKLAEFQRGFGGLVTFAVKANPTEDVLSTLCHGGLHGFDVASPEEIALARKICPTAALHYNNPVRTRAEIDYGVANGVTSWSVDDWDELEKLLARVPEDAEIAVRFKLPVEGAAYNFGAKFGATPPLAAMMLARVAEAGRKPSLTFHVGTQCVDPAAWGQYVEEAAAIASEAGVTIERLNIGGGFPASRNYRVEMMPFFTAIKEALGAFPVAPTLICEPGRGLVADAFALAVQIKSVRNDCIYLTDGVYGGLSELLSMPAPSFAVLSEEGWRKGPHRPRKAFGPTCDSIDVLRDPLELPIYLDEGDWIVFRSMGAYVTGVTTRFNGYGSIEMVTLDTLEAPF